MLMRSQNLVQRRSTISVKFKAIGVGLKGPLSLGQRSECCGAANLRYGPIADSCNATSCVSGEILDPVVPPAARARLQDIALAGISQQVRKRFCNPPTVGQGHWSQLWVILY